MNMPNLREKEMPEFTTPVSIQQSPFTIDYSSHIIFLGSCFAENIGSRMEELKFRVCGNPFGVLYNPLSIAKSLQFLVTKKEFTPDDLSFQNELWFSFNHYTLFSDIDKHRCLRNINESFEKAKSFIQQSAILFITLGTSWVYQLKETGEIVSNCHKMPASYFNRFFSSVENSAEALIKGIEAVRTVNPDLGIVFTVSPVRHWKDGAINNQRSKAALVLAIARIQEKIENVYYFPAYEIFMDELRDYRFYAEDNIHPSPMAQKYLWGRFIRTFMTNDTISLIESVDKILLRIKHKPRFSKTDSHKNHIRKTMEMIKEIIKEYPNLNFEKELDTLGKV